MTVVLETKTVTKQYQLENSTVTAVNEVSLGIESGEFVALLGPSGSGKTTMLAMIAGLLAPTSGEILIDGQELSGMSESKRTRLRREKIGFTFQANNLVTFLTALENVELMLRLNKKLNSAGRAWAMEILQQLGLGERLNSLPSQLSGGQQQRVAIARALVHSPEIVLADEPTASLDTERAFQVVETFAGLIHAQNLAGVMVTHDIRMCKYVDRIILMQDGRIKRIISEMPEILAFAGVQN